MKATALNRADTLQRQGGYPSPSGSPSAISGLEFAGRALEGGEKVIGMVNGGRGS